MRSRFKGSIQLAGEKKPLRHLIGMSEEFASGNMSAGSGRILLASSDKPDFVWAPSRTSTGSRGSRMGELVCDELDTHHRRSTR